MSKLQGINHLVMVRALEKACFQIIRQGKHIVMSNSECLVTKPCNKPIKAFTMSGIIKDACPFVEQFKTLL